MKRNLWKIHDGEIYPSNVLDYILSAIGAYLFIPIVILAIHTLFFDFIANAGNSIGLFGLVIFGIFTPHIWLGLITFLFAFSLMRKKLIDGIIPCFFVGFVIGLLLYLLPQSYEAYKSGLIFESRWWKYGLWNIISFSIYTGIFSALNAMAFWVFFKSMITLRF